MVVYDTVYVHSMPNPIYAMHVEEYSYMQI